MSAFITSGLPLRASPPLSRKQTPRCAVDTESPPESRFAKYYPAPRFEAPHISLFHSAEVPLVNKIGVIREPVQLDLDQAAAFLARHRAEQAKLSADLDIIFSGLSIDRMSSDPSDRYYPSFSRDQCPVIEITAPTEDSKGQVSIGLGTVTATPPPEPQQPEQAPDVRIGSPWNQGPKLSVKQIIDMFYGQQIRNLAPVIEFSESELGVSMRMLPILGECEAELYPKETRFMGPKIEMRKPEGELYANAFLNVEMEEVQLPLLAAAVLSKRN